MSRVKTDRYPALACGLLLVAACEVQPGEEYSDGRLGTHHQAVCMVAPPPPPVCTAGEVLIPYPPGTDIGDVTLLSTDLMELRDITVPGTVVNLGLGDTVVFSGATIGNIYSRALVDLRSGAVVTGFINTTTDIVVQGSASVGGPVNPNYQFDPEQTVSLCFPEPPDIDQSPNIYIDVGVTATYQPGTYNEMQLRNFATIVLLPGVYWVDVLWLEANAQIQIDTSGCSSNCGVVLNVRSEIYPALRGGVQPPNSDFLINYRGTLPVLINTAFDGFFVGMDAELRLNNNQPHAGAFFARQLYVDAGQTIIGRPFPFALFDSLEP